MSVTFTAATRTFNADFNADVIADIPAAEELAVNMSNSNAFRVCGTLGIDLEFEGWCGSLPAADFLGRVLLALAIEPVDAGVPSTVDAAPGRATFVDCGRAPGYTQERLGQLRTLADWAVAHNAEISFG
jgi:hypothetical protein